ncbi:MAG: hypothetical protein AAF664_14370 [Planctomycetota bacterium]
MDLSIARTALDAFTHHDIESPTASGQSYAETPSLSENHSAAIANQRCDLRRLFLDLAIKPAKGGTGRGELCIGKQRASYFMDISWRVGNFAAGLSG